jgi:hypothetical protein
MSCFSALEYCSVMSILHVGHIRSSLQGRFEKLIDLSDLPKVSPEERQNFFLTRALAAFVIAEFASLDDQAAAGAVVDGGGDNGIDAIYFDPAEKICYIVQAKWVKSGNGSVEVGEVQKFKQGINDLLEASFDRFSKKVRVRKDELLAVLEDPAARFQIIVAYTGQQALSADARRPLDDLVKDLNDPTELVSIREMRQGDLHDIIARGALGETVSFEVMLYEYGMITDPYVAYYGQMSVSDIVAWEHFGQSLTTKNLRRFKGATDVNDGITRTLASSPEKFWYFNNGITVLCEKLEKKPIGGAKRVSGVFSCEGASVVNGAQTVGSIIQTSKANLDALKSARVLVRLISLQDCPSDFASDVTRAANTQNRIEKRDFAALDPQQQRLRTDLWLEYKKEYAYQTGEAAPKNEAGCTLDEAAIALACAAPDVALAVQAKREVSMLYDTIDGPPYKMLFNPSTTAERMWRAVEVMRGVDDALRSEVKALEGKDRLIAVHGNRFVLHAVFQQFGGAGLSGPQEEFDSMKAQLPQLTKVALTETIEAVGKNFGTAYPASLFKNQTKCREMTKELQSVS